jgi:ubiquinone/menaquinone biosynthesis C-methylase UbiE
MGGKMKKDNALAIDVRNYWDKRFAKDGCVWGIEPSELAVHVVDFLKDHRINGDRILDLGCGYGRDSALLAAHGYSVTGIDFSIQGIRKASELYPHIKFEVMDVAAMDLRDASFDHVFGNFVLHLFIDASDRQKIFSECLRVLKPGGYLFLSLASTGDDDYGKGTRIADDTFRNERGVTKLYYNEARIKREFSRLELARIASIEEYHTHDKPHSHNAWFVFGRKGSAGGT